VKYAYEVKVKPAPHGAVRRWDWTVILIATTDLPDAEPPVHRHQLASGRARTETAAWRKADAWLCSFLDYSATDEAAEAQAVTRPWPYPKAARP
jgi:hypothetical protein